MDNLLRVIEEFPEVLEFLKQKQLNEKVKKNKKFFKFTL